MGEQFCLRWNNHQNTLISVFDNLLGTETLVDCTLVAEGKFVKGHKVVLSACSPLLEMLLSQHHDKHPIVILKDIKFHELRAMMDYMYRGEVNISQDQIDMFLKAAESLQIKGLTDQGGDGSGGRVGSEEGEGDKRREHEEESSSPTPKRRRRQRRLSQPDDPADADTSSSCDNQQQQQPNFSMAVTPSPGGGAGPPPEAPTRTSPSAPVKPEPPPPPQSHHQQSSSSSNSIDHIVKTKVEPTELLVQPKAEYIESLNNDDSVEDLTLDDEDEYSNMPPQPGTSHGNNISNQGFSSWQIGGDRSTDEVFIAAQHAIHSNQANSQGKEKGSNLKYTVVKPLKKDKKGERPRRGVADFHKRNFKAVEHVKRNLQAKKDISAENLKALKILRKSSISIKSAKIILDRLGKSAPEEKPKVKEDKEESTVFTEEDFLRFEREYVDE